MDNEAKVGVSLCATLLTSAIYGTMANSMEAFSVMLISGLLICSAAFITLETLNLLKEK